MEQKGGLRGLCPRVEEKGGPFGRGLCPRGEQKSIRGGLRGFTPVFLKVYYIDVFKNENEKEKTNLKKKYIHKKAKNANF